MEAIYEGPREDLDSATFGLAVQELCRKVVDSGYEPDWVVAIARGGLLIGGAVAYALSLKNIGVVNVEFYTDIDERLEVPVMLPPALNLSDLANQRLLIVDDVADTGETLQLVVDTCRCSYVVSSGDLGFEPGSVVVFEFGVGAYASFEFADSCWPRVEGVGDGFEADVCSGSGRPKVSSV